MALAGRKTLSEKLWLSSCLWALIVYQLVVFVPVGAYLMWRFPDWSVMYLLDVQDLPFSGQSLVAAYPVVGFGGFVAARRLLHKGRTLSAWGLSGTAVLLAAGLLLFGRQELSVVGSTARFKMAPTALQPIAESSLALLLMAAGVGIMLGWFGTLSRLRLLGAASVHKRRISQPKPGIRTSPRAGTSKKRRT